MKKKSIFLKLWMNREPYLFILPFLLTYVAFQMYPQLYSLVLSVSERVSGNKYVFVGLQNFADALHDEVFWKSLGNTVILWLCTLPLQLVLGVLLASLMVTLKPRFRGLLSGLYYLPVVTNLVAVTLIFQLIFDDNYGVLNFLLPLIGVGKVPWLTDPFWARATTIILITWRGFGYYVVYSLAGLMSVDRSLYECADIEGASYLQKQFYISIPSIRPILLYQMFTGTIAGWNIFLEPFLLFNKGNSGTFGPLDSVLTTSIYTYTESFGHLKFGYGAAMALMIAAVTTVFAVLQFRMFNADRKEG
jgi:lactose/L-arabinose transport system permease protein